MKTRSHLAALAAALLLPALVAAGPEIPGPPQSKPIALVGGIVHPVSGPILEGGTVLFDKGKIVAVGMDVEVPEGAETVSVEGKHVYPGLIDAATTLGLNEISAVRATRDDREVGALNPQVRAEVAVNPDSELIPVARSNGILTALIVPQGQLLAGQAALLNLDGWTWEDMTVQAPVAFVVDWPRMVPTDAWWMEDSRQKQIENRNEQLAELRSLFETAQQYWQGRDADSEPPVTGFDARLEALGPALRGEVPVLVRADEATQMESAVAFADALGLRLILLGGYDAPHVAPLLLEHDVPVILAGVHRLPLRRHDAYDDPFTLPQRLREAGVTFAIAGDSWPSAVRNLPYHAATAAAYGLPPDAALAAITQKPAEILGVGDRLGALEPGKDATLFVASGDILETPTLVEKAFVQGRVVDLSDRHKRLYEKYQEKYRQLEAPAASN